MSDASRRRFMGKFASLDYEALARSGVSMWFITLTTPEEYWHREGFVYQALRRFRDRLSYSQAEHGYVGAFVRRERGGKRGMLHYHLVIIGGAINAFPVADAWSRSLGYEGTVRVDVQVLDTAERVGKYLSKYCSKVGYEGKRSPSAVVETASSEPVSTTAEGAPLSEAHNVGNGYTGGRWWYVWGEDALPWGEVITIVGEDAKAIAKALRRIFRRWRVQKQAEAWAKREKWSVRRAMTLVSVRQWEKWDSFGEFLRRGGGGGFTFLLAPDLLQRMVDAACLAVAGKELRA